MNIIKEYIKQSGTNVTAFAEKAGISPSMLHRIIKAGKASRKSALKLENASSGVLNHKVLMFPEED